MTDAEFEQELAQHYRYMVRVAAAMLRSAPDDVDDCVQEAMLRAWKHRNQFDGRSRLSTWLHKIVVNSVITRSRNSHVMRRNLFVPISNAVESECFATTDPHAKSKPGDKSALIAQWILRLTPQERNAIRHSLDETYAGEMVKELKVARCRAIKRMRRWAGTQKAYVHPTEQSEGQAVGRAVRG